MQMEELAEALGPVAVTVVGMAMVYLVSSRIFEGKNRDTFITLYFAMSTAFAAYTLVPHGHLSKLWEVFADMEDSAKYALTLGAVGASYFLSFLFPKNKSTGSSAGKGKSGRSATSSMAPQAPPTYPSNLDQDPKKAFVQLCDMLIDEVIEDLEDNYEAIPEQVAWVKEMLEYNVKGGKMNRGLGVIDVQEAFAKERGSTLSREGLCRASVLGWCIEWLQAFFLVADDVMDDSLTRRGQPCWYKIPKVKQIAINDSFIIESLVFKILKRHFGHEAYYTELLDLFHDVTYRTEMGQLLDLTSQPMDGPADLERFTITRYRMIVKYKTAFYTFYLPAAIGMIYAGVKDPDSFALARKICCAIGEYFQIQDDYLDCFGDPKHIGKVGTDIQDNKCSWLVVQALQKASPEQKRTLLDNYGKHDDAKVQKVKDLYKELNLEDAFHKFEDESYAEIKALIAKVTDVPRAVFDKSIDRIHKRSF